MKRSRLASLLISFVAVASTGPFTGCGGDVALGTNNQGGDPGGTGGAPGTGGGKSDAALGTGGAWGGVGGTLVPDAPLAGQTGGRAGAVGSGGKPGSGGATSAGGSTGTSSRCGTIAGITCPAGQFCDLPSCGVISDAAGICVPNVGISCTADVNPVCGCNGQTYSNDCMRILAGVSKASEGACVGGGGGKTGTGGLGAGGASGAGGKSGTGGKSGSGGASGAGGSTGTTCGTIAGISCATGQFCDLASQCGTIADAGGVCRPTGPGVGCIAVEIPVCGCDGKTYSNDCERVRVGVLKAAEGACPRDGGTDGGNYPNAYLGWEAPAGFAGTGPTVVVSGAGWANTWDNVRGFLGSTPETPPSSATGTYTLTPARTDVLFSRLASVNVAALPHSNSSGYECYPRLYFRLCTGCAVTIVPYKGPNDLLPEMEQVWAWFDQLLSATALTNPRNYCFGPPPP